MSVLLDVMAGGKRIACGCPGTGPAAHAEQPWVDRDEGLFKASSGPRTGRGAHDVVGWRDERGATEDRVGAAGDPGRPRHHLRVDRRPDTPARVGRQRQPRRSGRRSAHPAVGDALTTVLTMGSTASTTSSSSSRAGASLAALGPGPATGHLAMGARAEDDRTTLVVHTYDWTELHDPGRLEKARCDDGGPSMTGLAQTCASLDRRADGVTRAGRPGAGASTRSSKLRTVAGSSTAAGTRRRRRHDDAMAIAAEDHHVDHPSRPPAPTRCCRGLTAQLRRRRALRRRGPRPAGLEAAAVPGDVETIGDPADPTYSDPLVRAWNRKIAEGERVRVRDRRVQPLDPRRAEERHRQRVRQLRLPQQADGVRRLQRQQRSAAPAPSSTSPTS